MTNVPVTMGNVTTNINRALVSTATNYDVILGTDWMHDHKAKIDIANQVLTFTYRNNTIKMRLTSRFAKEKSKKPEIITSASDSSEDEQEDESDDGNLVQGPEENYWPIEAIEEESNASEQEQEGESSKPKEDKRWEFAEAEIKTLLGITQEKPDTPVLKEDKGKQLQLVRPEHSVKTIKQEQLNRI